MANNLGLIGTSNPKPNYVVIRDSNFNVTRIIEPSSFSVSLSKNGSNSLSFKLSLNEELVPIGSLVNYHWPNDDYYESKFGGIVTARDIDTKNKVVSYSGVSWYGKCDQFVAEFGSSDAQVYIYSEIDQPGKQFSLSSRSNGFYPMLYYDCEWLALPFNAIQPNSVIDVDSGDILRVNIPVQSTLLQVFQIIEEWSKYVVDIGADSSDPGKFKLQLLDLQTLELPIGSFEDVIVSEEQTITAVTDNKTMHYYANDNTYKSKYEYYSFGNFPTDLMYNGWDQVVRANNNDNSNKINQQKLKSEREKGSSKVTSTFKVPMNYADEDSTLFRLAPGHKLRFYNTTLKRTLTQTIMSEVFELKNGAAWVTFELGGNMNDDNS